MSRKTEKVIYRASWRDFIFVNFGYCPNSALLGLVFGNYSAVAVRLTAALARAQFALLSRRGSASRTWDGKGLLWAAFFVHHGGQNNIPMLLVENGQL
jgi:hypothetical protein